MSELRQRTQQGRLSPSETPARELSDRAFWKARGKRLQALVASSQEEAIAQERKIQRQKRKASKRKKG